MIYAYMSYHGTSTFDYNVRKAKDKAGSFLGDAGNSWFRFVVSYYYRKMELDKNSVFQRIFELSGGFSSCPSGSLLNPIFV
jgi:hypothetical protein